MKLLFSLSAIFLLTVSADSCHKKKKGTEHAVSSEKNKAGHDQYKGRLEIKAACMNYTIKVTGGNIDTSLVEANWFNTATQKTYTDVFALGSRCNFPASIAEGEEFYFSIDPSPPLDCAVCMIYYPTPAKKLSIKVMDK